MESNVKPNLYISFCREDTRLAKFLGHALERRGLSCKIAPRDTSSDDTPVTAIPKAITQCDSMALVYSSASRNSGAILNDVILACDRKMPIHLIRVEKVELSEDLHFYLSGLRWHNAFTNPELELEAIAAEIYPAGEPTRDKSPGGPSRSRWLLGAGLVGLLGLGLFLFVGRVERPMPPGIHDQVDSGRGVNGKHEEAPAKNSPPSPPVLPHEEVLQSEKTSPLPSPPPHPSPTVRAPTPPVSPEPSSNASQPTRMPDPGAERKVRLIRFIKEHWRRYNTGDKDSLLREYAPTINYYRLGVVGKNRVQEEYDQFFKRWVLRDCLIQEPFMVMDTQDPDVITIQFTYRFYREQDFLAKRAILERGYAKGPKDTRWCSSGVATDTFTLRSVGDTFQIIGETQDACKLDEPTNVCRALR